MVLENKQDEFSLLNILAICAEQRPSKNGDKDKPFVGCISIICRLNCIRKMLLPNAKAKDDGMNHGDRATNV